MEQENQIPEPPSFSEENMQRCREAGDYRPILFEWYKFVSSLTAFVAHVRRDSPALRSIPVQHYYVLVGLLNRCARLMLSNVTLSHEGRFGETIAIIDRCIFETSIKIFWLCSNQSQERFTRYLADGLRTELEFRTWIEGSISSNNGKAFPTEVWIVNFIDKHIAASGLSKNEINSAKKLPNLATMINDVGYGRLTYLIGPKFGAHHVHGTWPSLLMHYLEYEDNGETFSFVPRGHDCDVHVDQFAFVPLIVLQAMTAYINYVFEETEDAKAFAGLFESTAREIMRIYAEATIDSV